MLKKYIIVFFVIMLASSVFAASHWLEQTAPSGITVPLYDVCNIEKGIVVAVGKNGKIIKSTDYGVTWKEITSPISTNLNAVSFASSTTGYIAGDGGKILISSDSGESWSVATTVIGGKNLNGINFKKGTTTGIAIQDYDGAYNYYPYTTDGTSWNTKLNTNVSNTMYDVFIASDSAIFAVGAGDKVYKMTAIDNGTWTAQTLGAQAGGTPRGIYFIDATNGWIVGDRDIGENLLTLYKTNDGGISWNSGFQTYGNIDYNDVFMTSTSTVFAVGNGVIYKTENANTWLSESLPSTISSDITFYGTHGSTYDVWAVGGGTASAKILKLVIDPAITSTATFAVTGQVAKTITLTGTNFKSSTTTTLKKIGSTDIVGTNISVNSDNTQLSATFDLSNAATGSWTLRIVNPDADSQSNPTIGYFEQSFVVDPVPSGTAINFTEIQVDGNINASTNNLTNPLEIKGKTSYFCTISGSIQSSGSTIKADSLKVTLNTTASKTATITTTDGDLKGTFSLSIGPFREQGEITNVATVHAETLDGASTNSTLYINTQIMQASSGKETILPFITNSAGTIKHTANPEKGDKIRIGANIPARSSAGTFAVGDPATLTINMYDLSGRLLYNRNFAVTRGQYNRIELVDYIRTNFGGNIPNGIYNYIAVLDGAVLGTGKVVIDYGQ